MSDDPVFFIGFHREKKPVTLFKKGDVVESMIDGRIGVVIDGNETQYHAVAVQFSQLDIQHFDAINLKKFLDR